ncbi:ADP-dependent glucokinase-like [Haliotis cracherodii]|uniref:ADP-dependent glucokinase-like n=1 Tax=Haliotis cracherodii TaxID=6455 RepID=UPI0039E927FD
MIPKTLIAGVSAICIAYIFAVWNSDSDEFLNDIERSVIEAWGKQIEEPIRKFERVAVGINSNVDLIVPGVQLLRNLGVAPGRPINHQVLSSISDLQETFAFFFRKGSAAERTFTVREPFLQVIEEAETFKTKELYIGGNGALMAAKASMLFPDVAIQFVGPIGPLLQQMMPASLSIPETSLISKDEFHLIMEYKVGEVWGEDSAPVANRFISSCDYSNSRLTMLDTFFNSLDSFNPDLILMSGLHLLDGQTSQFFSEKIALLSSRLQQIPSTVPIHLEFASMATQSFVRDILENVLKHVDSLGLNEQELVFSSRAGGGPHSRDTDHQLAQPEVHKISDILLWFLHTYGLSEHNPSSRLTRIHFHSLTYHISATVGGRWRNLESSIAAGTRIAGIQACNVSHLSADILDIKIPLKYKLFSGDVDRDFNPARPVVSFSREGIKFVFSPVLVCKHPLKTVGLGDAISTTGLMYSQFVPS